MVLTITGFCQQKPGSEGMIDSLSYFSSQIWKQKTDSARLQSGTDFFTKLEIVLRNTQEGESFPDSIAGISHVSSENGYIHIYTWNIPLAEGSNKYFGFVCLKNDSVRIIPLISVSASHALSQKEIINSENWYGAVYYKLIMTQKGSELLYTVLGWDGFSNQSNRKIIDIVQVSENHTVTFGSPVFKTAEGLVSRVIFEYNERTSMLLRYDYQSIKIEKRNKIKLRTQWMIVMDHLIPMDPQMDGIKKYYVPAGDIYDGFLFSDGFWVLAEDIEATNRNIKIQ